MIRPRLNSDKIYPGLTVFKEGKKVKSIFDVPGILEAGYIPSNVYKGTTERDRNTLHTKMQNHLDSIYKKIKAATISSYFLEPVSEEDAPDYHEIIKFPIDLYTIGTRLKENDYYRFIHQIVLYVIFTFFNFI